MTLTIPELNAELVEELRAANINAEPYKRAPIAQEIGTINIDQPTQGGRIRLWAGLAEVELATDPDKRQAVLIMDEKQRSITRTFGCRIPKEEYSYKTSGYRKRSEKEIGVEVLQNFPVWMPNRKLVEWKEVRTEKTSGLPFRSFITRVTATLSDPGTKSTFLLGIDETSHFIAALPKTVHSVESAHRLLRPPALPKDTLRQGEFFFVPATGKEKAEITRLLGTRHISSGPFEAGSSHRGTYIHVGSGKDTLNARLRKGNLFAIGMVYDTRVGRHAPLMLNDWHKVVRNREVQVSQDASTLRQRQPRRYWD